MDTQIALFIVTSLAIILTPGQDMLLVISKGVSQGSKNGMVTSAGVGVGLLGHSLLAAFGLGAFLMASEMAFIIIKYIGAAYLIYLGVRLFLSEPSKLQLEQSVSTSFKQSFIAGAFSNIANPKITIFYFAYLPQFISADIANPAYYLFTLGASFALLAFIVKAPIGYLSGRFSGYLQQKVNILKWFNRTSGAVLLGLGIKLAFESKT